MEISNQIPIHSSIIVSNDLTSKQISINKNTNLSSFYSELLSKFPNLEDMTLFYFEGYMKEKFIISNEREYIIANKKGIEYFYLCGNKKTSDTIDYLKYYSVFFFSPLKTLNQEFQINDRKKMQLKNIETINEVDEMDENDEIKDFNLIGVNIGNMNNILYNNQLNNFNYNNNIGNNFNFNNFNIFQEKPYGFINNNNFGIIQYNINNNNNMFMNDYNPNMQNNNIINLDNINKELLDAFMNDKNKYNYMIQNMSPALLESCQKRMAEINAQNKLLNPPFSNNIINYYNPNMYPININIPNYYNNNYNINNNFNSNKIKNNLDQNEKYENNINELIPEYETIDTELDPVNKYIENAIKYSSNMKHLIVSQKKQHPEYFINIEETLSSPGLLLQNNNPSDNDYKYILCLLGKILENKGIEVGIYQNSQNKNRIYLSAIQFIFSGLISKKKYRLKFSEKYNENYFVCMNGDSKFKKNFIDKLKTKISSKLKIDKNLIILTNPRNNLKYLFIDMAFNPKISEINEKALKDIIIDKEIISCDAFPLLGGCMLSSCIFKKEFNKFYNNMFQIQNKKIGGEDYIRPLNWTAYGLNISEKYDFGDNNWLGNTNKKGEFAVAYYGINNLINNSFCKINSLMGNNQTGNTFVKVKNIRKPWENCKSGAYFFKNPNFAENSCEKINIGGFEYKIMFMCRVNPSKIMQPEKFKDCWILSPTSDEVRPYKILIKKIPISPLAIDSQEEIKICIEPPQIFFDIMNEKDESYLNKFINPNNPNNNINNNYNLVLQEWTGLGSGKINNYLRNNIISTSEKEIKSNIWCLHKAITESVSNVNNNITVYRGIKAKIPNDIGIGTKFYFREFLSTSKDIVTAMGFANCGTLMHISIQNNGINGKKVYCRDIENISQFSFEKEIIFTAFCQFIVTDIKKEPNLDVIYLTCDGYNF